MSETGDYLRGIFNGEIPVKRKNPQTGETENVYYKYDDDREELKKAAVYPKRATGRFYEPMAFASAQPEEIDYTRYGDDIPRELINRMNADDRFWQVMNIIMILMTMEEKPTLVSAVVRIRVKISKI